MQKNRILLFAILTLSPMAAKAASPWTMPPAPGPVITDLNQAIMNITNWLLGIVSLIAVLVIIWGGVLYLSSAGNEDWVRDARKTIQYGVQGLVIAGLAYAVVKVIVTVVLKQ